MADKLLLGETVAEQIEKINALVDEVNAGGSSGSGGSYAPKLYRHLIKIAYSDTNYSANATLTIISKDAGAYGLSDLNTFLAENGYLMTDSTLNSILTAEGYPAIGFSIANRSTYYMVKSVAFDKSVGGSFLVAVKSYNANITQSGNTLGLWITNISDAVTVI